MFGGPDDAGVDLALNAVRNPVAVGVGIDLAAATRTRIGLVRVRRTAVARVDRSIAVGVRRRAVRDLIRVLDAVSVAVDVRADRVRTVVHQVAVELVRLRIVRGVAADHARPNRQRRRVLSNGQPATGDQGVVSHHLAGFDEKRIL